jgi:hypothetical protein
MNQSQKWYQNHKEEKKAKSKLYRQAHKEQEKERYAQWRAKLKLEVFSHYSNGKPKCSVCGEENLDLLTLDHINGDGKEHHITNRYSYGTQMWFWARKNSYPAIFQVLCYKHNTAKGHEAFIPKAQLEDWLVRLERPRAGSLFDTHAELGMMYVLRKLLGLPVKSLLDQASKWKDKMMKNFYENLGKENQAEAKERSLRKLLEQGELDRLAENCHDEIVKELKVHPPPWWGVGWAKVLSPIIWAWYEKVFPEDSAFEAKPIE